MNQPSFLGIVLAAGISSRMGRDKALLPWPPESPTSTLLASVLDVLEATTDQVMVIAGDNEPSLEPIVYARAAYILRDEHPSRAEMSSLRLGLRAVLQRGRDAAVVMRVDRPPASTRTIRQLQEELRVGMPSGIWATVPTFEGMTGHPVVFGRDMIEAVLRARETSTWEDVFEAQHGHVRYVGVEDPCTTCVVTTPEEYERALRLPSGDRAR